MSTRRPAPAKRSTPTRDAKGRKLRADGRPYQPTDATMRNVKAARARDASLAAKLLRAETRVRTLTGRVTLLEAQGDELRGMFRDLAKALGELQTGFARLGDQVDTLQPLAGADSEPARGPVAPHLPEDINRPD